MSYFHTANNTINPTSADFRPSQPFMYVYGNTALRAAAKILFFTVFTGTALLLDLEAPPEGPGSTLRVTDKNHLVLQLMANKPYLCAYQGLLRCVPLLCPAVPPPSPWGQLPASLLLSLGGCWSHSSSAARAPMAQWHWKQAEVSHGPTTSPQPPAHQCGAHLVHATLTACDGYSSVLTAASPCFCLSLCSLQ